MFEEKYWQRRLRRASAKVWKSRYPFPDGSSGIVRQALYNSAPVTTRHVSRAMSSSSLVGTTHTSARDPGVWIRPSAPASDALRASSIEIPSQSRPVQMRARISGAFSPIPPAKMIASDRLTGDDRAGRRAGSEVQRQDFRIFARSTCQLATSIRNVSVRRSVETVAAHAVSSIELIWQRPRVARAAAIPRKL